MNPPTQSPRRRQITRGHAEVDCLALDLKEADITGTEKQTSSARYMANGNSSLSLDNNEISLYATIHIIKQ